MGKMDVFEGKDGLWDDIIEKLQREEKKIQKERETYPGTAGTPRRGRSGYSQPRWTPSRLEKEGVEKEGVEKESLEWVAKKILWDQKDTVVVQYI